MNVCLAEASWFRPGDRAPLLFSGCQPIRGGAVPGMRAGPLAHNPQITGIFLFYLVWDAVLFENSTQLFASMLLAFAISLARIIANSVGRDSRLFKGQALGWFIFLMHVVTIVRLPSPNPPLCPDPRLP